MSEDRKHGKTRRNLVKAALITFLLVLLANSQPNTLPHFKVQVIERNR